MIISTLLCWLAWVFIIINIDPFQANTLGFVFFYVSLFLALIGTISLFVFLFYHLFSSRELPLFRYVQTSFKQSLFVAALITLLLYLRGRDYLNLWNAMILIGIFVLFISFSLSLRSSRGASHETARDIS